MGYAEERANEALVKLQRTFLDALLDIGVEITEPEAADAIDTFVKVTPPVESYSSYLLRFNEGGVGGGSSTKPGNIELNIHKLVRIVVSGTLAIASAISDPWTLMLGALVTWDAIWSCLQLTITEDEACVLWTLWIGVDANSTARAADLDVAVNLERLSYGLPPLSSQAVERALETLRRMKCVEQSLNDPSRLWLREWIRVKIQ
jgi:hypothetical protein